MLGYMVATGSACSSKKLKASHVLTGIGLPIEVSHGSIRIGISKYNTKQEIEDLITNLAKIVQRLREMSPVDSEFLKEWNKMKEQGNVEIDHHHDIEDEEDN